MKCSVPGCITNDDIVSCTSVFFVNFPKTRSVQQQWYTVLDVTSQEEKEGFKTGRFKICSTHFPEECFATHPQYGYRFLQHNAIPSVFPVDAHPCSGADDHHEQDELDGSQYDEQEQRNDEEGEEIQLVAQPEDEAENTVGDEAAEEFGIQYANGKYFILKMVDQPSGQQDAPSLEEVPNEHDGEEIEEEEEEEEEEEGALLDEFSEGNAHIIEEPPPEQCTTLEVYGEDGLIDEREDNQLEECIEDRESKQLATIECTKVRNSQRDTVKGESEQAGDEQQENIIILQQEEQTGRTNVSNEEFEVDTNAYGTIEALDEMSVYGDQVRVSQRNHKNRPFTEFCEYCKKGFHFKSARKRHEVVHTRAKPFTCEICNRSFSQKVNLACHMQTHSGKRRIKPHACGQCDASFDRVSGLIVHQRIHERQSPYECPICYEVKTCSTTFYDHLKKSHKDQITLKECLELMAHTGAALVFDESEDPKPLDEMMRPDGRYQCTACEKVYTTKRRFNKHMRTMHPKIFMCPHCYQKFPYKSLLQKHITVHTKEHPYPCSHCDAKYTQKSNLVSHMIRHHPDRLQPEMLKRRTTNTCTKCHTTSVRADFLHRHRCVIQPARKRKQSFTEPATNKRYGERAHGKMGAKSALKEERFHSPTFQCGTCNKTWRSSLSLRNHRCRGAAALEDQAMESEQDIPSASDGIKDQYDDEQFMEEDFNEIGVMVVDGYTLDSTEPTTMVFLAEESSSSQ
ncbi:hypothetical protein AND_007173 [Anopheles darlingi]|uniref:Uncharacterized protein n=1 Tax=Anopheles darlingi TaxID=43151 RepID=W5JAZ7_ANODA|nr:hypothetical protein AND_007173 [Anopheles darlingi]